MCYHLILLVQPHNYEEEEDEDDDERLCVYKYKECVEKCSFLCIPQAPRTIPTHFHSMHPFVGLVSEILCAISCERREKERKLQ